MIDNRPGAASTVGLEIVAKSPPDGYTVGVNNIAYGANPAIYKKMPFDSEKDFVPVTLVSIVTPVATVHPSIPARSIKQLIALVKSKPGTPTARPEIAARITSRRSDSRTWRDSSSFMCRQRRRAGSGFHRAERRHPCSRRSHRRSSTSRRAGSSLAVSSAKRNSALPELPTISEAGVPGYEAIEWQGLVVPTGTPQNVIRTLYQATTKASQPPEIREKVAALGAEFRTARPRSSRSSREERFRGVVQGGEGSRDQDRLGDVLSTPLHDLTATDIVAAVRSETTTCEAVTRACIDRIAKREPQVQA